MRKATLLYNARSGGRRKQRENDLQEIQGILAEAGVHVSLTRTQSSADAAEQARKAILEGCDTVFACGGDGTVHDVLQGVAGSRVALGVIPMGTANALAHDLGIPMEPHRAARAVLDGETRRVAVGQVTACGLDGKQVKRHFTVAVGIGVDAHLFYKLHAGMKQRLGMRAYYAKAWHLWCTHRMERFRVEWEGAATDHTAESRNCWQSASATLVECFRNSRPERLWIEMTCAWSFAVPRTAPSTCSTLSAVYCAGDGGFRAWISLTERPYAVSTPALRPRTAKSGECM